MLGVGSSPCCAGPHHPHGGIPVESQYGSTKTPIKTHTSRARRKRQRLPSNASIRTDAAIRFPLLHQDYCAASLPIECLSLPIPTKTSEQRQTLNLERRGESGLPPPPQVEQPAPRFSACV